MSFFSNTILGLGTANPVSTVSCSRGRRVRLRAFASPTFRTFRRSMRIDPIPKLLGSKAALNRRRNTYPHRLHEDLRGVGLWQSGAADHCACAGRLSSSCLDACRQPPRRLGAYRDPPRQVNFDHQPPLISALSTRPTYVCFRASSERSTLELSRAAKRHRLEFHGLGAAPAPACRPRTNFRDA